jgi:hypothetical protein
MVDRLRRVAGTLVPIRRAEMELGHQVGLGLLELVAKDVSEQVVIAEPFAPVVERHEEEIRLLCLPQQPQPVGRPRDRIAERG